MISANFEADVRPEEDIIFSNFVARSGADRDQRNEGKVDGGAIMKPGLGRTELTIVRT